QGGLEQPRAQRAEAPLADAQAPRRLGGRPPARQRLQERRQPGFGLVGAVELSDQPRPLGLSPPRHLSILRRKEGGRGGRPLPSPARCCAGVLFACRPPWLIPPREALPAPFRPAPERGAWARRPPVAAAPPS